MTIMNKKIMQKLAKFNCSKNKQTKAVNQIKKATSYMLLRRCNRCSSAVCLQNINKSKSLFTNQLLSILSSKHRLHKSFIVGIQRNQNFRPIVAPKPAKRISKTKNPHDFFSKEISLVQYMNKKKEHQNIQLRSQAHPRNPPGKMNKKKILE